MLYLAKLITAVLATGSLVAAYSSSSSHSTDDTGYEPYGCKVTIHSQPDGLRQESTVLVSWIIDEGAFKGEYSDNAIDLDLMKGNYVTNQVEGPIRTGMDNSVCDTLWHVNSTTPVGNDYFLRLRGENSTQCFTPLFSINDFNGDGGAILQPRSQKGEPMVMPAAPVSNNQKRSLVEKVVASSSSRKADGSVTNLIAGLLVFGAFL
ncbi:unnamed protein product [Umbelopsis ramanniana]